MGVHPRKQQVAVASAHAPQSGDEHHSTSCGKKQKEINSAKEEKRGPEINSDPISLWPSLYAVISAYVATQRKNGDIVNVHKLAVHLQDETDEGQNRGLTFSYLFCKYWFKKNRVRVRSHPQEGERCKK